MLQGYVGVPLDDWVLYNNSLCQPNRLGMSIIRNNTII